MGILLFERGEFGADIFYLVLAGNYAIEEPFEFEVVLSAEGVQHWCNRCPLSLTVSLLNT